MRTRFLLFMIMLFALGVSGCVQPNNETISPPPQPLGQEFSTSQPPPKKTETIEPSEAVAPTGVITLRQVLALTLVHNPELKAFSWDVRIQQARQLQAGLWPNPKLRVEVEEAGGSGDRSGFDGAEATIQLSQLIELGGKSDKRVKVASIEQEVAELDFLFKKREMFSEAAKAYIEVLKAQESLQLSNEILKLSEESFRAVQKRVDVGKDSPVEKTRASVVLSNIRMQHRQARRDLEYARRQLAFNWGQDEPSFERAAGDFYQLEPIPAVEDIASRLNHNPGYVRWEAQIKKSRAVLDLEKSNAVGDITIGAGIQRFNETNENAIVFGVSIPLPVSDRNQGGRQEAVYNLAKSRAAKEAAWITLQSEFDRAFHGASNAFSQATSLNSEVLPAATEMFDAATRAYQEGKVDYLNVLDAQRTLFGVKNEYIESLADYHIEKTEIACCVGNLEQMMSVSESKE
jgi:cobalt-zinc-cadmium efflux system outer membrane protein